MRAYYKTNIFLNIFLCSIFILVFGFFSIACAKEPTKTPFPSSLPLPSNKGMGDILYNNTPEYVVIRPSDQVTFSSEAAANVQSIYVKEGSRFNLNDVLLKLDCRIQQAELKKALAQQEAAIQASTAAKRLKSYGTISQFELVKAISDEEVANAEVDKLEAIVDKCIIRAPFDGAVSELMVHQHESVKQGDPLLKIVNLTNLQFELLVPSCWLRWLKVGSEFKVMINEIHQEISAKITKINPQIEPVSQSVRLIATISPPNPDLLPGMSGHAIFPEEIKKNCLQSENNHDNRR